MDINFKDIFPYLFEASGASTRSLNQLLTSIGTVNDGELSPPNADSAEDWFVDRVANALDRQVTYYLNMIRPKNNSHYLGESYLQSMQEDHPMQIDDADSALNAYFSFSDRTTDALEADPSFKNYTRKVLKKGRSFSHIQYNDDVVVNELQGIHLRLLRAPSRERLPVAYTSTIRKKSLVTMLNDFAGKIVNTEVRSRDRASVLYNHKYFDALFEAIEASTKSISVLMFYFAYDGRRKKSIPAKIVTALIDAHDRGVEVNVIVDKDREGEKYYTRKINRSAVRRLRRAGINARTDAEDEVLHSKVVVVDGKTVFIGTHNFSNSSNYRYEELSVRVSNKQLAKYYDGVAKA